LSPRCFSVGLPRFRLRIRFILPRPSPGGCCAGGRSSGMPEPAAGVRPTGARGRAARPSSRSSRGRPGRLVAASRGIESRPSAPKEIRAVLGPSGLRQVDAPQHGRGFDGPNSRRGTVSGQAREAARIPRPQRRVSRRRRSFSPWFNVARQHHLSAPKTCGRGAARDYGPEGARHFWKAGGPCAASSATTRPSSRAGNEATGLGIGARARPWSPSSS